MPTAPQMSGNEASRLVVNTLPAAEQRALEQTKRDHKHLVFCESVKLLLDLKVALYC
jgi:hypothetical protein